MIASGEKKEEYREFKPYWINYLTWHEYHKYLFTDVWQLIMCGEDVIKRNYDLVKFTNGYGKNALSITLELKGITIGSAKPEWSDNWKGDVFIIKLGNIYENPE